MHVPRCMLICILRILSHSLSLSVHAIMATNDEESKKIGEGVVELGLPAAEVPSRRQRFHVELNPDETNYVSWTELLETGTPLVDDPVSYSFNGSDGDDREKNYKSACAEELGKRKAEITEIEGENSNGPSAKHIRLGDTSSKDTPSPAELLDKPSGQSSISSVVNDKSQSFAADAPILMYKKNSASFSSKSNCSLPLTGDGSIFPQAECSVSGKTKTICSSKGNFNFGISTDVSVVANQNFVSVPELCTRETQVDRDENKFGVTMNSQHHDNSSGSGKQLNLFSPVHKGICSSMSNLNLGMSDNSELVVDQNPAYVASVLTHINSFLMDENKEGVVIESQHCENISDRAAHKPTSHFRKNVFAAAKAAIARLLCGEDLKKALEDLNEVVLTYNPIKLEASDAGISWPLIELKIPVEVRTKLSKVGRVVEKTQATISGELVQCLVDIFENLVYGESVKEFFRDLFNKELLARKEKGKKIEELRAEIDAMASNRQGGAYVSGAQVEGTYELDHAMEDKLRNVYDLCLEGLDGDQVARVQNLYVELQKLWPKGVMTIEKLRGAVRRSTVRNMSNWLQQPWETVQREGLVGMENDKRSDGVAPFPKKKRAYQKHTPSRGKAPAQEETSSVVLALPALTESEKEKLRRRIAKKNGDNRFFVKKPDETHKSENQGAREEVISSTVAIPLSCRAPLPPGFI